MKGAQACRESARARLYKKALRKIAASDWIVSGREQACRVCGEVRSTEDHQPDCPTRIAREALAPPPEQPKTNPKAPHED